MILAHDTGNWINSEKNYLKNRNNMQGAFKLCQGQSRVQRWAKIWILGQEGQHLGHQGTSHHGSV